VTPHYDPAMVQQFVNYPDDYLIWHHYDALEVPVLCLRGAESDLVLPQTLVEMQRRGPGVRGTLQVVEVPGCGHAPALNVPEHLALIIGSPGDTPLIRLHSACLTGDVLGSLKCDCGPQLHEALHQISEANWGILLYLRQEGRGIGLINKLRAYALQDQGFDTVDANTRLGFAIDARDFSVAARMLELLGISNVRLLTNNPEKVEGLRSAGISVEERLPLKIAANPHNAHYLETKKSRTGHAL
jgi:GTP cyclohydrolase II